jgi:ABC-2 type transport system permease protein
MNEFLRITGLMFQRSLIRIVRNPVWVMIGLFQPILYLLLFAPLLDDLPMPGFEDTDALNVFVPGLLVMMALFGAGFSGFGILDDLRDGVIERFRVTPANRMALLLGMMLHDVLIFLIQCALMVITAALMGMTANLGGLLLLFGLLTLLGLMMVSFSYAITLIIRDQGALAAMLSTLTQPMLLLSGVLLPLTLAPDIIRTLADVNPLSHIVDASRALLNGSFEDSSILLGFGIVTVLMLLCMSWASRLFRQATA